MKKCFALALGVAIVLGYSAAEVQARGGGGHGGGGHSGGGHHGGDHHAEAHHGGTGHHAADHHGNHHANNHHGNHHHNFNHHYWNHAGNRPYTQGWYGNHGWGGYGIPYAGWWGGAGFGAAAAWLGMNAASTPVAYNYPSGGGTVYTSDTGTALGATPSGQLADSSTSKTTNPATSATTLAQAGTVNPTADSKYLPLGVYSLAPQSEEDAAVMMHLAVTKEGVLRGSYYDLASHEEKPIQGAVDKQTQRVAFTVGTNSKDVFETSLASLTNDSGPVALQAANGRSDRWTIARLKEPPTEENEEAAPEAEKQS